MLQRALACKPISESLIQPLWTDAWVVLQASGAMVWPRYPMVSLHIPTSHQWIGKWWQAGKRWVLSPWPGRDAELQWLVDSSMWWVAFIVPPAAVVTCWARGDLLYSKSSGPPNFEKSIIILKWKAECSRIAESHQKKSKSTFWGTTQIS